MVQTSIAPHRGEYVPGATDGATCPLCGASGASPFLSKRGFVVRTCSSCGLRFTSPQPNDQDIDALYSESYFKSPDACSMAYDDYLADGPNIIRSSRARLKRIAKILGVRGGDLLDVGCAAGFFLKAAREHGFRVHGVEISRYCVDHMMEPSAKVHCGTLDSAKYPDSIFDIITMWDVIEHLKNPAAVLAECRRILRPRGALVVMTPNIDSVVARVTGKKWVCYDDPDIHLFYYGPTQLARELDRAGFDVRRTRQFWHGGKHVPLSLAFERVARYAKPLGMALHALERTFLANTVFYLDIGDNMVVYATAR